MPPARKYDTPQEKNREASRRRREREGKPVTTPPRIRTPEQLERNRDLQRIRDSRRRNGTRADGIRPGDLARMAERAKAEAAKRPPEPSRETRAAVTLYQREKAKRAPRIAAIIAEARRQLDAADAAYREQKSARRGRPKKNYGIALKTDPANALVNALNQWDR